MSYTLIDTGERGRARATDNTKATPWPAMIDGYCICPTSELGRGGPVGVRTPLTDMPAGWEALAALVPHVPSGHTSQLVEVARAVLAEVIA